MGIEASAFRDRTVLVTGAASGIGLALCRRLAGLGAIVTAADVDGDAVERAVSALGSVAGPGTIRPRRLDVRDRADVEAAVVEVVADHGRLDVLVNNAGLALGGPTEEVAGVEWDRVIDVNLRGVVNGVLAAYPRMVAQGHGRIVNTASGAGLAAPPSVTAYAATKHAVVGLSTSLRAEAALHGVGHGPLPRRGRHPDPRPVATGSGTDRHLPAHHGAAVPRSSRPAPDRPGPLRPRCPAGRGAEPGHRRRAPPGGGPLVPPPGLARPDRAPHRPRRPASRPAARPVGPAPGRLTGAPVRGGAVAGVAGRAPPGRPVVGD